MDDRTELPTTKHPEELRLERERLEALRRRNDALEGRTLLIETIAATMKAKR